MRIFIWRCLVIEMGLALGGGSVLRICFTSRLLNLRCMCMCSCACVCMCIFVNVYVYVYVCCPYTWVCMCICIHWKNINAFSRVCTRTHTQKCKCLYVRTEQIKKNSGAGKPLSRGASPRTTGRCGFAWQSSQSFPSGSNPEWRGCWA